MENLEGPTGPISYTVLRSSLKPDTKVELIVGVSRIVTNLLLISISWKTTDDIGRFGAAVFRVYTLCRLLKSSTAAKYFFRTRIDVKERHSP